MGSKNLYIAGLFLLIGVGGGLLWYTKSSPAPATYTEESEAPGHGVVGTDPNADPFDVVIMFTDTGFSPNEITITQGQRVRFVNRTSNPVWPASGVHPTHSLYPEKESTDCLGSSFDACKGLQFNEYFDFTFNYVGQWRYHDHLQASKTGVITVVAK